jgi:hypothetical protein
MKTNGIPADVAKLICGNIDDLKCYLHHCTDAALVDRAILWVRTFRESKTKERMLGAHLRRLQRAKQS